MANFKSQVWLFVFLGWIGAQAHEVNAANYGRTISTPAESMMSADLKAAVGDLQAILSAMTGQPFSIASEEVKAGVLLRRTDDATVPAAALKAVPRDSQEASVIWPDGDRLWIVARSDTGLSHAVYLYLESLGCRWYFPAEEWTIIPRRPDITITKVISSQPAFRSRLFAGTGGFGGNLPLDPTRSLQQRWTDWQRRNRFGGEFRVSGHTGEAFNLKYRTELESHPEWRAMINGKRVPWSLTAKFCAGNQEVVDLYVKDRLEDYRRRRQRDPNSPHAWAVSVEPADGGGHCTAPESLAIGSVSDRVFHVANQVAAAVREEFPEGRVSLFAYNQHAAAPSIDLEPNVYVQVIPYAFQRTGLSPDQLLDAWSKKVSRMGVYDYWSIPDWSHDLPTFDPLVFGPDRLRGWHRRGVDSFLCESTYSSGAMGPAWYIASRLAWEPEADVDALHQEFLNQCFGPAAPPMERMLARWSQGFHLTSHELALSFRDVQEAWRLAENDSAAAARVADYGRYVQYLRLYFEYKQTKRGSDARGVAAERLMRYVWSIYDTSMIHAFRLSQLLARDERIAGQPGLAESFNWQDPKAPGWATIHSATDQQVAAHIEQGVAELQPQNFTSRRYTGPLVRLPGTEQVDPAEEPAPTLWLNNSFEFYVLADRENYSFAPRIATENPVQFLVTGPDGQQVDAQSVVTGESWRTDWSPVNTVLPQPGMYRIQVVSQKRMFRFSPPTDAVVSFSGWSNSQGTPTPRLYFYVPKELSQLAIYTNYTAAGPPRFFDPEGVEAAPQLVDQGHLMIVPIAKSQRGKVWSMDRAKCPIGPLQMLNAPSAFALHPRHLLIPKSCLPEQP